MADLATLQRQLDQLKDELANPSRVVREGDREVQFRSTAEIQRAIDAVEREIAAAHGRRVTTFIPTFTKGL